MFSGSVTVFEIIIRNGVNTAEMLPYGHKTRTFVLLLYSLQIKWEIKKKL
jgi:hypothetical protein